MSPHGAPAPHPDRAHPTTLYDMIWRRPGGRFPFPGRRLPPRELGAFTEAARLDGASLYPAGPEETARLLELTAEAERRSADDHHWQGAGGCRGRDSGPYGIPKGLPVAALGPRDTPGRLPRERRGAPADGRPPTAVIESRPTIAVLTTAHDRRADWLRAGQALEHVLLLATALGIRASLLHQALEWSDLRWALSDGRRAPGHVQMLIRLGGVGAPEAGGNGRESSVTAPEAGVSGPEGARPTPAGCHRPGAR